jgi:hypothetical protein
MLFWLRQRVAASAKVVPRTAPRSSIARARSSSTCRSNASSTRKWPPHRRASLSLPSRRLFLLVGAEPPRSSRPSLARRPTPQAFSLQIVRHDCDENRVSRHKPSARRRPQMSKGRASSAGDGNCATSFPTRRRSTARAKGLGRDACGRVDANKHGASQQHTDGTRHSPDSDDCACKIAARRESCRLHGQQKGPVSRALLWNGHQGEDGYMTVPRTGAGI